MAKAESKPKMKGHGKIDHMRITPAREPGTFTSETQHAMSPGGPFPAPEKPTIHPSLSHLVKHVKNTFGGGAAPGAAPAGAPMPNDEGEEAGEVAGS